MSRSHRDNERRFVQKILQTYRGGTRGELTYALRHHHGSAVRYGYPLRKYRAEYKVKERRIERRKRERESLQPNS
jgi:hypothetical protein